MKQDKKFERKVLRVLKDIIDRNNPTITDGFVIETLLALYGVTTSVDHRVLRVYDGLYTKYDVIEFLKDYKTQLNKRNSGA